MKSSLSNNTKLLIAALIAGAALLVLFYRAPLLMASKVDLSIPYVSQIPDGQWVAPWDEACEEATIAMVDAYYRGEAAIDNAASKKKMQEMIEWETREFNKNFDTDAAQTTQIIAENSVFRATVKRNPLLQDIKQELASNRPVIAHLNMYKLYQEKNLGDSYHVLVITGYDDETNQFIVNDPAREGKRYAYEVLMNALHDFNPKTREADGVPTVLFTNKP
ncbi:C39 family peptidase [Candidatus Uhrbacteria bacterium]|nr:C39 family peptidase [Candidatus Uhrbacteria bacterium]